MGSSQSQYRANLAQQRHSYYGPTWGAPSHHAAPHLSNHGHNRQARATGFGGYALPPPHLRRHS